MIFSEKSGEKLINLFVANGNESAQEVINSGQNNLETMEMTLNENVNEENSSNDSIAPNSTVNSIRSAVLETDEEEIINSTTDLEDLNESGQTSG